MLYQRLEKWKEICNGGIIIRFKLGGFELSGSIYMQISTRGNGNLVRVNGVILY